MFNSGPLRAAFHRTARDIVPLSEASLVVYVIRYPFFNQLHSQGWHGVMSVTELNQTPLTFGGAARTMNSFSNTYT